MSIATPKTALITGAGKRIGRALAADLAERGWAIGVHYATAQAPAEALVDEIRQAGGTAYALQADLADAAAVELLMPEAVDALGPIGLLVNNA